MDLKTLKKHIEAEKAERRVLPFYKRIPLNIGDFLWYRLILRIKDLPEEIMWKTQELTRGYSDCDVWNLNRFIIKKFRKPFRDFYLYQSEEGKTLPTEFKSDPAAWLLILSKINFAFDHEWRDMFESGYDPYKNLTNEQVANHIKAVQEGFELFGKWCRFLWD